EVAYLESYDRFVERVRYVVEMPSAMYDLLHRFLRQNDGTLSKRARTKEFAELTEGEVDKIETIFGECME
ncbi:MAG: Fic family protein, partial [Bacteroidota bacterium]